MCYITATEFKNNLSYYMQLSNKEDVYVTKNGRAITVLTSPGDKTFKDFMSLRGVLKGESTGDNTDESQIVEGILAR